jgi:hypothetical protein
MWPAAQPAVLEHVVLHAVAPQLYGEQLVVVGGAHVPVPSQTAVPVAVPFEHDGVPHTVLLLAYAHAVPSVVQAPVVPHPPVSVQAEAQQVPCTQWPLLQSPFPAH